MNKEDKLVLGTLAGVYLILSPEHYEEYKGTLQDQLEETVEKIKNKEDMQDVISNINEISKNLYELPLYHDFIEMMALFNKTYDACLLATNNGDNDNE